MVRHIVDLVCFCLLILSSALRVWGGDPARGLFP